MPVTNSAVPSTQPAAATAVTACYCLGARHRVITNCLECGYLLCEQDATPHTKLLPSLQPPSKHATTSSTHNNKHKHSFTTTGATTTATKDTTAGGEASYDSLFCTVCQSPCVLPYTAQQARDMYGTDMPETARYVRAYEMKDRLLQFDQEHAQRTKVFDAQGDYYNAGTGSAWLSEQERKRLEAIEAKRQQLQQRSRIGRKVNIVFNIAGQRVVDVDPFGDIDEEEETLLREEENGFSTSSEKAQVENEARRLLVCKAIWDERDVASGDSALPTSTNTTAASVEWVAGGNSAVLKETLLAASTNSSNSNTSSSAATNNTDNNAADKPGAHESGEAVEETITTAHTAENDTGSSSGNSNSNSGLMGLENTTMQLQGTRAAETYRYMRQHLLNLTTAAPTSGTMANDNSTNTNHIAKDSTLNKKQQSDHQRQQQPKGNHHHHQNGDNTHNLNHSNKPKREESQTSSRNSGDHKSGHQQHNSNGDNKKGKNNGRQPQQQPQQSQPQPS